MVLTDNSAPRSQHRETRRPTANHDLGRPLVVYFVGHSSSVPLTIAFRWQARRGFRQISRRFCADALTAGSQPGRSDSAPLLKGLAPLFQILGMVVFAGHAALVPAD